MSKNRPVRTGWNGQLQMKKSRELENKLRWEFRNRPSLLKSIIQLLSHATRLKTHARPTTWRKYAEQLGKPCTLWVVSQLIITCFWQSWGPQLSCLRLLQKCGHLTKLVGLQNYHRLGGSRNDSDFVLLSYSSSTHGSRVRLLAKSVLYQLIMMKKVANFKSAPNRKAFRNGHIVSHQARR